MAFRIPASSVLKQMTKRHIYGSKGALPLPVRVTCLLVCWNRLRYANTFTRTAYVRVGIRRA
jgi:hypothetical protein